MSFGFPTFSQNRFTEQYSGLCPIAPGRGAGLQPCRRDCPVARWLVADHPGFGSDCRCRMMVGVNRVRIGRHELTGA
ncbi:histone acetyltransferase [Mycobacterium tuberculosis]|uniref:histone acetyltransferase n=1 Tax=Mycobacterium tuberculosis TaxID=1773 RepID=UPI00099EB635|nr:histone acetyltransferase [Mycobacterium tuberculosis]